MPEQKDLIIYAVVLALIFLGTCAANSLGVSDHLGRISRKLDNIDALLRRRGGRDDG